MAPDRLHLAVDATPLLGPRTGVGMFTAELLGHLASDPALAITAWAATWRGRGGLAGALPPGVTAARRPMAARPLRQAWAHGDRPAIEWWTGPVDVVHGTNFVVPPTRSAAALVTVHDLTVLRYPELCTADTLRYPGLLRRALARGAHVHTPSVAVAEEVMEAFALTRDRVHAIPEGVPPVAPTPDGAGRALAGADRFVLALGTVEPRKDHPALVAAFDEVAGRDREVHLVVAGPDGWGADALAAAVAGARHRDRIVRLDGYLDDDARSALLRDATVLAYPSRYEGFGLPPLEAMTVGVPVVATRAGALPEVLGEAALWCDLDDHAGLVAALTTALDDDAARSAAVARGHRQVARYSWDATAAALTALYRRLAADRGRGRAGE